MSYRLFTAQEYERVKTAVQQRGAQDSSNGVWRGLPDENESEIGAFQALRSVFPQLNVIPTSVQLRELGELYRDGYIEQQRTSSVSPAAAGKRRRKTKRTRLQRKKW